MLDCEDFLESVEQATARTSPVALRALHQAAAPSLALFHTNLDQHSETVSLQPALPLSIRQ